MNFLFKNVFYLLIGMLIRAYDSWCRRDDQPTKCYICKRGIGVVAYEVPKSFSRTERVAFCKDCIEGMHNTGGLS